jgi:hypothetical protein
MLSTFIWPFSLFEKEKNKAEEIILSTALLGLYMVVS